MIQSVQGRATLGHSTLVPAMGAKAQSADVEVRVRVGKGQVKGATIGAGVAEDLKMPKAVLPFGKWPPGSEKVDERTGAIQAYKTVSVADELAARVGGDVSAAKEDPAAPSGGNEFVGEAKLQGEEKTATGETKSGENDEARRTDASTNLLGKELDPEEVKKVSKLKERDAEVRRHENAHKALGGAYTGAISYEFEIGPDGKRYVKDGEVPVDLSQIRGSPDQTIRKMKTIRRAATAPSHPSAGDMQVAMKAAQIMNRARYELAMDRYQEAQGGGGNSAPVDMMRKAVTEIAANHDGEVVTRSENGDQGKSVQNTPQVSTIDRADVYVPNHTFEKLEMLTGRFELSENAKLNYAGGETAKLDSDGDYMQGYTTFNSPANDNIVQQVSLQG